MWTITHITMKGQLLKNKLKRNILGSLFIKANKKKNLFDKKKHKNVQLCFLSLEKLTKNEVEEHMATLALAASERGGD